MKGKVARISPEKYDALNKAIAEEGIDPKKAKALIELAKDLLVHAK